MELVKKNILSIICGVLAVVAVVLCVWPLHSWMSEAKGKLTQRAGLNTSMQALLKQPRSLPSVALDGGADRQLDMFPTPKAIEWAGGLKQKLADEAQQVKKYAVSLNARPVLLAGVLPVAEPTKDYEFRDKYLQAVEALPGQLHMGPPPSPEDINAAIDKLWDTQYESRVVKRDGVEDPASLQEQNEAFDKESKLVPERMKQQRARQVLCYMDENVVIPDAAIGAASSGTAPAPQAMWYAQMHYWVQGDVLGAIAETNRRASKQKCVIDSPIKYVRKMTIGEYRAQLKTPAAAASPMAGGGGPPAGGMGFAGPTPEMMEQIRRAQASAMAGAGVGAGGGGGGLGAGGGGGAGVVKALPTGGKLTGASPTGRVSNPLYDVIPVELVLDVEAERLPYVLAQLGNNDFITPYEVSIASVDSVLLGLDENVMYGPAPVVRATIYCELLMFRDWTVPLMPVPIKQALGVEGSGGEAAAAGM